jgi:hypothetical protein
MTCEMTSIDIEGRSVKLLDLLRSPEQGRWRRYWVDDGAMPTHEDMNMAGHLNRTDREVARLVRYLPDSVDAQRTEALLKITGWIHDLGELTHGDVLYQLRADSDTAEERAAFTIIIDRLFKHMEPGSQHLLRHLYRSVALPTNESEKHPTLAPLFKAVEKLGYLRTALEVALAQPADVKGHLLSTSVLHYHQNWFAEEATRSSFLHHALKDMLPDLRVVLELKRNRAEQTQQELRAELQHEVTSGKRQSFSDSEIRCEFTSWWRLCDT